MDNPRPEKVAVVEEVKERFASSQAVLLTDYRGIDVVNMGALRRALRAAGGDYKIYKNTLVRFAVRDLGIEVDDLLVGPTALAFVPEGEGDPVTVAKALKEFARTNDALVVKGGVLGEVVLSADQTKALADVAPREELLARLAGAMAAPMQQFAGLLQALPRNFAYGLAALIEQGGAPGVPAASTEPVGDPADSVDTQTDREPAAEATGAEATDTTPDAEASADTPTEES